MTNSLQKILCVMLILCYSIGASFGNIFALRDLHATGDKQNQHLTSGKRSSSIPGIHVGIVRSHIAPVIASDYSLYTAPVFDESVRLVPSVLIGNAEIALIYSSLEFLPSKPRDPPLA